MVGTHASAVERHEAPWIRAHEALSSLAKARASAEVEEGRWLLAALRSAVHVHLGFGAFGEYVERLFGYSRRFTREKLRVAEALEELPALARAFSEGALNWSAVRELTRVAVPETEREWLAVAKGKTARQLEELVAGKAPGATPTSPADDSARRHVLRFEVEAETLAVFRQALAELRRRAGSELEEDALLLEMARQVLGGPRDEGRATYQLAVTVCAECGAGRQDAGSDVVAISAEVVAMAHCDAQHLGRVDVEPLGCSAARHLGSGDVQPANDAVPPHVDRPNREACPSGRAKQDVPPAVRRAVLRRDHGRCRVPGCRNARFLDVHHIVPRSEGGDHHAENLLTVCGAHHRALHRCELTVERAGTGAVRFKHADGAVYGGVANPKILDTLSKVFSALRGLGFRETEVSAVLGELRAREELEAASIQDWLRAALQRLTPACQVHASTADRA